MTDNKKTLKGRAEFNIYGNDFEYIKAMTVEEMAEYIFLNDSNCCYYCIHCGADHTDGYDCREGIQKWLESEVQTV